MKITLQGRPLALLEAWLGAPLAPTPPLGVLNAPLPGPIRAAEKNWGQMQGLEPCVPLVSGATRP